MLPLASNKAQRRGSPQTPSVTPLLLTGKLTFRKRHPTHTFFLKSHQFQTPFVISWTLQKHGTAEKYKPRAARIWIAWKNEQRTKIMYFHVSWI